LRVDFATDHKAELVAGLYLQDHESKRKFAISPPDLESGRASAASLHRSHQAALADSKLTFESSAPAIRRRDYMIRLLLNAARRFRL
jgi:hypothetical protein